MDDEKFERYFARTRRRPVVVGYNGRPHAQEALVWAATEASRRDVPLLVLYAANYPGMTLEPGPGLLDPSPSALEAAEEITARGVTEAFAVQPGLRVDGVTEVTSPTEALIRAAAGAGLVVIGTRGYGRVLGSLLGSVAFAVAARAPCPVIVVKAGEGARPAEAVLDVVVGTDGSPGAVGAVRFAADHAAATSSRLRIVTCTGAQTSPGITPDQLRGVAQQIADEGRQAVRRTHPHLSVVTEVEDGPAERVLVEASAAARLVVVGTRGRGAFHGMLLGSVSHAVIHGSRCPVAIIGADALWQEDDVVASSAVTRGRHTAGGTSTIDVVEIWGYGSFPASDPPANW